ncbi:F0F1 ATP synthase subunit A [Alkalicella caledoniensis]|uniref:ATP synthase subunit a n=1 Tax=Alkalicella caledoniensis TaxID=2731377 RepID=A0A7G9W907_ALKCA|nr:F0F1 ATP synthase subunit A [Alkalicella caledoniensis]QNO15169.1 F0F1 ATP synthase subunit A [Alkalicella caledoniensis]
MEQLLEGPRVVLEIFGLEITESIRNMWIIMAVIIILAIIMKNSMKREVPNGLQNFTEFLVETVNSLVSSTMGDERKSFAPYMGTLLLFIGISNISGIFGILPPTADINVTVSLAVMTFLLIHYNGLKKKGFGHIKGLAEPVFVFFPLNVIGELAKPVSLAFRLFGNIFAGSVILAMIYGEYGILSLFIPILPHMYFDLFAGLLQSFIFVMLTMVFITLALE